DPAQDEPAVDHFDRHLALTIAVTTGDPCDLSRVGDRVVLDLEAGETARLGERVAVAARRVLQEPGETASLTDVAERSLRIPSGEIDQGRSSRRRRPAAAAHARGAARRIVARA